MSPTQLPNWYFCLCLQWASQTWYAINKLLISPPLYLPHLVFPISVKVTTLCQAKARFPTLCICICLLTSSGYPSPKCALKPFLLPSTTAAAPAFSSEKPSSPQQGHCCLGYFWSPSATLQFILHTVANGSTTDVNQVMLGSCFLLAYSKTQISFCGSASASFSSLVSCYCPITHKAPGILGIPKKC